VEEVTVANPAVANLKAKDYTVIGQVIVEKLCQRKSAYYIKR